MSTIHLRQTTTLTPEQYIAGLTDFGPGRAKLFGNSADDVGTAALGCPGRACSTNFALRNSGALLRRTAEAAVPTWF